MEELKSFFAVFYVVVFFGAVFVSLKFQWGNEGKDERGQQIINKSYSIAFPLIPLGWFLLEMYHDYVSPLSYDAYKLSIWFLLTGLFILHAASLLVLKRKM